MQTVTEILIDFSSSMNDRLTLVKEILLKDVIPELDFANQIGIKTFTAVSTNGNSLKIEDVLSLGIYANSDIKEAVEKLGKPDGNTPIALAIKDSVNSLKEFRLFDKRIVLITDGEENCGGNYELEAQKAGEDGVFCEIHIIGIGLNDTQLKQANRISVLTSGSVSNVSLATGNLYNSEKTKVSLSNFSANIKRGSVAVPSSAISDSITKQSILAKFDDTNPILTEKEAIPNEKDFEETQMLTDKKVEPSMQLIEDNRWDMYDKKLDVISEQLHNLTNDFKRSQKDMPIEIDENAELNEKIRVESESYLNIYLRKKYYDRVVWLNENGELGDDHDFEITEFESQGVEYFIECKGTSTNFKTFYLTKNEWRRFLNSTKNYQLYFIMNVFSNPTHIFVDNFLDWLLKGKIVPYSFKNEAIKKERIFFTILD